MNRSLRVLHIGNGRAFKIQAIVEGLARRGHQNHMVPIPPSPPGFSGAEWHAPAPSPLPGQLKVVERMLQIRRTVRQVRPDIVHAHNAWGPGWYGAAAGHHPFVIHAYGGDLLPEQYAGRPAMQRRLTAWACRAADKIVVTGRHMVGASRALGIPPDKIVVLPRGVDLRRYHPGLDTTALRRRLDIAQNTPVILSPRYQVDEALYNLDTVIDAFAEVLKALPSAVCLQMHDPAHTQGAAALRQRADLRGLGTSYRLVPSVDNDTMPLFYCLADVALSIPSSDGFPVTVLEASACACPLVVTDLPYCAEWFVHGENGYIVPIRDAAAVARAVTDLCRSDTLRRRVGNAGRALVEQRADYDRCMDMLEATYFDLLRGAKQIPAEVA